MKRRLLSILLALCMLLSVIPMFSITASAAEAVSYRYPVYNKTDGTFYENASSGIKEWKTGSCTTYTGINSTTWGTANTITWYVVTESVTIASRAEVTGDVHLILKDGVTLTCSQGITVSGSNSLTVYSQSTDVAVMGKLIATKYTNRPGIGSNTATTSGYITINGGKVKATGANGCAGIGGYDSGIGSNITINGGEVEAIGGTYSTSKAGAGIGGGHGGSGSNITINGGTVTATGGNAAASVNGAGIGGGAGSKGSALDITINGGTVIASGGGDKASGIGGGQGSKTSAASSLRIYVAAKLTVKAGITSSPTTVIASDRTNDTDIASSLKGKQYATITPPPTYAITSATCTNGSVSADVDEAAENDTVTVTPTANSGYEILSVYYQPDGESLITITPVSGVYSFTMPGKAVVVGATFKLSKNRVSEDITISFKTGYTPTAGDTLATLLSNVEYSNTTLLDYNIMVADSEQEELSSTDTLKAGETYYFIPLYITPKDSTNYEFSGQTNTAEYKGNVTVLGDNYTYVCGVLSGDDFEAVKDIESANALGFYFLNTAFPTFTVPVPTPEPVKNAEYYASLTLGENIDINFSMEKLGTAFTLSKLTVTVDGGEPEKAMTLDKSGNVVGVLKAVAPHEMGKSIHIVVTYDGVTVKDINYSILDYCNAVYNAQGYGKDSKLGKLCTALLNYGKWAEDYYNEANKISADASTVNAAEVIDFSGNSIFGSYTAPKDEFKASEDVTYAAGSLTLGSTITLNFYVFTSKELSVDNINILNNLGEKVNPKNIAVEAINLAPYGAGYIIKINNIGASKLSRTYTLTINGVAESIFKIVYGVESYCYNVQDETGDVYTTKLKTLCKAIYNYAEAAKAYSAK